MTRTGVSMLVSLIVGMGVWDAGSGRNADGGAATQPARSATAPAITLKQAEAHYARGLALQHRGSVDRAIEEFRIATGSLSPCAPALNHFAWLRATFPDSKYRDGAEAVRLSERAWKIVEQDDPSMDVANILDTLAAAYAEGGRFADAVSTAKRAMEMARSLGNRGAAAEIDERLRLYESDRAFHEADQPPPVRPASRPSTRRGRN